MTGMTGAQGFTGFTGMTGMTGAQGVTGPTGPGGISQITKKFYYDVYDPSNVPRPAMGQISLNSIGALVGDIDNIENSIISIKEPVYPNGPNFDYVNDGINNYGNWARPRDNNSRNYANMPQLFAWYYPGSFFSLDTTGWHYSRFDGPFDIIPRGTPVVTTPVNTFYNSNYQFNPTTLASGTVGDADWTLEGYASTDANDKLYRLTQCYYFGCFSDNIGTGSATDPAGCRCYRSFMTDCSAGITDVNSGCTNPIKWPQKGPNHGFLLEGFENDIEPGKPFMVNVNFVFQIQSTQTDIELTDDIALFGQINFHPERDSTVSTPYIDWSANPIPAAGQQPTSFEGLPGGGGCPFNIMWRDISSSSVAIPPFRPQYSGDLIFKKTHITPINATPKPWGGNVFIGQPDISGGCYNIPIQWQAKCYIPTGMESGINWGSVQPTAFDLSSNLKPTIYAAFTIFNTAPEWGLNQRSFTYNIILNEDNPVPITPINAFAEQPMGGYGSSKWASSRGFRANMSITPII